MHLCVDAIHFMVRFGAENQCVLVVIGATADGKKELVAGTSGFRDSEH